MSTVLHPVGPRPPRVYWVRRLVVLGAVVLVAVVLWAAFGRGAGAADGATAAADDGAGAAQEDAPADDGAEQAADQPADEGTEQAPADQGPPACGAADLTVALTTDGRSYPEGTAPTFTVAITNSGAVACTVDADATQREVVITSGSDRIWGSLDCPPEPAANLLLLEPGARSDATFTWERVRSDVGCPADLPAPRAGTYSAVVTMLGATSAAAVFNLT